MSIPQKTLVDREMVLTAISGLAEPNSVVEVRIPQTPSGTVSGYFDDSETLANSVIRWSGKAPGVYVTLNPVQPALLARASNRLVTRARHTTSDSDIVWRRWLPLDFDPVRPSGISATDAQHDAALERANVCRCFLRDAGWAEPVFADSGNGAHLLFRIDLPNDAAVLDIVRDCLMALSLRFTDNLVQVDVTTGNAARIWKLYGTLACKGDNTAERPHRLARLLEVPATVEVVSRELLEALAEQAPGAAKLPSDPGHARNGFRIEQWIAEHELPIVSELPWQGGRKWVLNPCPWDPSHTNRSAYLVQLSTGAIAAGCHHNSCRDQDWHSLPDLYEPGWRGSKPADTVAVGTGIDDSPAAGAAPGKRRSAAQQLVDIGK